MGKRTILVFNLPDETTLVEVIEEILKENKLEESNAEYFRKSQKGMETRLIIIKNTAQILAEKKVPEEKLAGFLAKHLETTEETAKKIIQEINQKLIPFAKIIDIEEEKRKAQIQEKEEEEKRQQEQAAKQEQNRKDDGEKAKQDAFAKAKEELLKKIGANDLTLPAAKEEPAMPYKKNPDITDVEDNAKNIQETRKPMVSPKPAPVKPESAPETKPDPYKESVE